MRRRTDPRLWHSSYLSTYLEHDVRSLRSVGDLEDARRLIPIEAKVTATPTAADARNLEEFQDLFGKRAEKGLLVCLCRKRFPLTRTVDAVPFGSF